MHSGGYGDLLIITGAVLSLGTPLLFVLHSSRHQAETRYAA